MKINDAPIALNTGRIAVIVDQSGSMLHQRDETITTINAYVRGLRHAPGKAFVSLYTFDGDRGIRRLLREADAKEAAPITREHYSPGGATPLYEAIISVISELQDKHVVVILTDGQDTSGQSSLGVNSLIKVRESQGWEFIFLGAGLDRDTAVNISSHLGLAANRTVNYNRDQQERAMHNLASSTAAYASSGYVNASSLDFAEEQQDLTKAKGGVMQNGGVFGKKIDLVDPADGTTLIIREVSEGEIKKQTVKP